MKKLPDFRRRNNIDVCIANGENSAKGNGVTPKSCNMMLDSGVDLITLGNHTYKRVEIMDYLDRDVPVVRPYNYPDGAPGRGVGIIDKGRYRVAVINMLGTVFSEPLGNPFSAIDNALKETDGCKTVIVDFHAEATAEKKALGYYLDGRVSAVFGTHTHVMTADATIMPKGTAYITDIGMTGPKQSVLGVKPEISIEWLRTGMPARFDTAEGECMMNGCVFEFDNKTGKAISIEPVTIE